MTGHLRFGVAQQSLRPTGLARFAGGPSFLIMGHGPWSPCFLSKYDSRLAARLSTGEVGIGSVQAGAALGAKLRGGQYLHRDVMVQQGVVGAVEPVCAIVAKTSAAATAALAIDSSRNTR